MNLPGRGALSIIERTERALSCRGTAIFGSTLIHPRARIYSLPTEANSAEIEMISRDRYCEK